MLPGPAWAGRRSGVNKLMSRHKLNLIEECKNNRVKTVILAFIRASAIRGRDGGGRLDVVGAGLDPKGTGVDDGAGPPVEGRKLISTRADVDTHHRRHQEVTEEGGGRWWWTAIGLVATTSTSANMAMAKSEVVDIGVIIMATATLFCVAGFSAVASEST